nr:hypothetical protein [Tanacetum cinerariifolium]
MSVKYPTYVNLTSSSEEHPNERTPSPPPIKKSLSPPQAPSKSISSKSTHYTSSSLPRGDEILFTSEAWRRAFDINKPIYTEPCKSSTPLMNLMSEEELVLSRSSAKTIRKPVLKVIQKMITYSLCQRTTGEPGYDEEQQDNEE